MWALKDELSLLISIKLLRLENTCLLAVMKFTDCSFMDTIIHARPMQEHTNENVHETKDIPNAECCSVARGPTQQGINPAVSSSSQDADQRRLHYQASRLQKACLSCLPSWVTYSRLDPCRGRKLKATTASKGFDILSPEREDKTGWNKHEWKQMTYCAVSVSASRFQAQLGMGNKEEERISCPDWGRDVWKWKYKIPVQSVTHIPKDLHRDFQMLCVVFICLTSTCQTSCLYIYKHMCNV